MSEMVERVARAMCKAADDDWDWSVFYIVDVNDTAETGRDVYREMARAAIEALMEPTEAMVKAGSEQFCQDYEAPLIWASMIQAALKEQE